MTQHVFAPIHIVLASLIGVVLLFNAYQISVVNSAFAGPELPELEATLITVDCEDCAKLGQLFSQLKDSTEFKVEAMELPSSDPHAQKLMQDHGITKLPAIVVEGDADKVQLQGFTPSKDALLLQAPAPYYDVKTGRVAGLVSVQYVLAEDCQNCTDLTLITPQLKQIGVSVISEKKFTASSAEGKQLIETYALTKLPAAILSPDAGEYDFLKQTWTQVGDIAPDGSYVVRVVSPPYYDLASKSVKGKVTLISLYDSTCTDCYNVSMHKQILQGFGIFLQTEKMLDINLPEGKSYVTKYSVTSVPTIILQGDQALYPAMVQVWPSVGTVEADGAYVFRKLDQLGVKYVNVTG